MSEENKINEVISEVNDDVATTRFCSECGEQLLEGQKFCPKCGKGIEDIVPKAQKSKINKKYIYILFAVIILGVISIIGYTQSKEKQRQEAIQDARIGYLISVEGFKNKVMKAGANLEDIADTVQTYWGEYIFDKKHGYSIESAVSSAMDDKSHEVKMAEKYDEELLELYRNLKNIPEGSEDLKDTSIEVDNLYNSYSAFYNLATDPTGNYSQYSNGNNEKTDKLLDDYRVLDNRIKTSSEFVEIESLVVDMKEQMNVVMREYKAVYDLIPKELENKDEVYKKMIPDFQKCKNIDISKIKEDSEKFKNNETIKNAIDIVSSTSEYYDNIVKYAKQYKKSNSKEDLEEFKTNILSFRPSISMYTIHVDSLEDEEDSLEENM